MHDFDRRAVLLFPAVVVRLNQRARGGNGVSQRFRFGFAKVRSKRGATIEKQIEKEPHAKTGCKGSSDYEYDGAECAEDVRIHSEPNGHSGVYKALEKEPNYRCQEQGFNETPNDTSRIETKLSRAPLVKTSAFCKVVVPRFRRDVEIHDLISNAVDEFFQSLEISALRSFGTVRLGVWKYLLQLP